MIPGCVGALVWAHNLRSVRKLQVQPQAVVSQTFVSKQGTQLTLNFTVAVAPHAPAILVTNNMPKPADSVPAVEAYSETVLQAECSAVLVDGSAHALDHHIFSKLVTFEMSKPTSDG